MANDKKMMRGVQQALYKYLPGSWVDFAQSGGGVNYAVHVDNWISIPISDINNKRLLRVVNQHVNEYINTSPEGAAAVVDFASNINEDSYEVLTPRISETTGAIQTSVKPWVFICNSCGHVRQYYSYDEFKKREHTPCEVCQKGHMTQLKMIRFCKCGYADGIFVPKCSTPGHGTKYMSRRGSGTNFVCTKCGKKAALPFYCPDCRQKLEIKPALDSSHYIPFTFSIIDLLDKRKDIFLDKEENSHGERVVIAQYLGLVPKDQYETIIANGKITKDDEFEEALQREALMLKEAGLDDTTIATVLDAKRRTNPNGKVFEAIAQVGQGLSISKEELTQLAEEILEYDELIAAKVTLSLEEAESDAEIVFDGIRPDYKAVASEMGFSHVQLCSGVPIVTCSYGYTRRERSGEGVKLHGFPREMEKRNVYAARLETEGVLFELDRKKIVDWLLQNDIISSEDSPADMSEYGLKMWIMDRVHSELITPFTPIDDSTSNGQITKAVYTLVHSISHALISEVAEICGLDKSSLSEYILPNIPAVFIYCSNSQGFSMGALYSAFQTHFDRWLKHARSNAKKCIFDPICINHEKACAGCLFLNEVSCRHFNKDLDRSYLCGHFDVQNQKLMKGYWQV